MRRRATGLVSVRPLLDRVGRFTDLIGPEPDAAALVRLRAAQGTGRPLGSDDFLSHLERRIGRRLRPRKPGPKPRTPLPGEQLQLIIREMGKVSP